MRRPGVATRMMPLCIRCTCVDRTATDDQADAARWCFGIGAQVVEDLLGEFTAGASTGRAPTWGRAPSIRMMAETMQPEGGGLAGAGCGPSRRARSWRGDGLFLDRGRFGDVQFGQVGPETDGSPSMSNQKDRPFWRMAEGQPQASGHWVSVAGRHQVTPGSATRPYCRGTSRRRTPA